MTALDHAELVGRLGEARVCLLFTPGSCAGRPPLAVLRAALPHVEMVQVRIKAPGGFQGARETYEWTRQVLGLLADVGSSALCIVNDRVDVARALAGAGCAGAHVGQDDCPPELARRALGPDALLGLSTHTMAQVAAALLEPLDYLGFGPFAATATKGYAHGLGAETCWVAASAWDRPLFAIGGIDATNVGDLARVGRVAVSSAVLGAEDPALAAQQLAAALRG